MVHILLYMTSKSESTNLDKPFVFRQKSYLVFSVLIIIIIIIIIIIRRRRRRRRRKRRRTRRRELFIVTNGTEPLYISSHQALE